MRSGAVLRLCARPGPRYVQGQRRETGTREYFYYTDHQGQNFTTCFRDERFLSFFSRLERNRSGRHEGAFPWLSRCGRERNFLRCEDVPVVFTALLPGCGYGAVWASGWPVAAHGRLYHRAERARRGAGEIRAGPGVDSD
uniref:Uncharacterized protein n=1 Tax=Malurus cyaneus samueli TaxID=2593467 RepID=A0A8C5X1V0_9PASS